MSEKPWNRCDDCGKFIAMDDFDHGAIRTLVGDPSEEEFLTLCIVHGREYRAMREQERREREYSR